ncbi:hypothetical protein L9F63_013279 [Diploptera punctata]|uniref:Apolipoprotein D n=1 Tax=Diploptera punctata TaxID=6984 RepID=A0AAD8EMQ1_DIPPU|nr:hypothetical protein L9F63_013279 [Diploptera punctata]
MSIQCSFSKRAVNMARIVSTIAALIVIILAEISAQSLGIGRCPKYPAMKKLDVKKIGGQWYEVERSFYLMEMFSTCTSLLFTPKPSGTVKVTIKTIGRLTGSPSVSLGTAVPIKNGSAELDYRVDTKFPSAVARMMPSSGRYSSLTLIMIIMLFSGHVQIWGLCTQIKFGSLDETEN